MPSLPMREAEAGVKLRKPALRRLFRQLSIRLGSDQLMTSAVTTAMGDLKTPAEARCRGKKGGKQSTELAGVRPSSAAFSSPPRHCPARGE